MDCLLLPGVSEGGTKTTALGSCLGAWVGFSTSAEVENMQEKGTVSELPISTGYRDLQSRQEILAGDLPLGGTLCPDSKSNHVSRRVYGVGR